MGADSANVNAQAPLGPRLPIRRFDVFAEYNRLKGLGKGMDEAHAKGYGLWVAKVVASGGRRRSSGQGATAAAAAAAAAAATGANAGAVEHEASATTRREWHELGEEPQTDALFDREVIARMGPAFYTQVFAPAIAQAVEQGRSYESIRDTLRKEWTPARP